MLCALPLPCLALPAAPPAPPQTVVTEAELRRVIVDFVAQKDQQLSAEVSVKKVGINGDLKLPPGKVSYEVVAPERWEGWGNASLALIVRVDDRVLKNLTAVVEVEALAEMGLCVPDDISVAGFDDTLAARTTVPQLTTVRQPLRAMGHRAVEVLLARIAEQNGESAPVPIKPVVFPVGLVLRASVGARWRSDWRKR